MAPTNPPNAGSRLAHVVSIVFLPPLLAIATIVALCLHDVPDRGEAVRYALLATLFVAVIPCAYVAYLLHGRKIGGGMDLALREERLRPYLVGAASNIVGLVALTRLSAPQTVTLLTLAYGTNALVMAAITQRWKISAHAAGAAMPLTALINAFGAGALPLAVIVPVVCWARVRAQMHSVAQVCAGALLGFTLTWAQFLLIAPRLV